MNENYILLKLVNGQEVVGKFVAETLVGWEVIEPLALNFQQVADGKNGGARLAVSLVPFVFGLGPRQEKPLMMLRQSVAAFSHEIPQELVEAHLAATTGLVLPKRG